MQIYPSLFVFAELYNSSLDYTNASDSLYSLILPTLFNALIQSNLAQERMQGKRVSPQCRSYSLKLFLNMVPSSSAEVTRSLRGCFRGIDAEDEICNQIKI